MGTIELASKVKKLKKLLVFIKQLEKKAESAKGGNSMIETVYLYEIEKVLETCGNYILTKITESR